MLKNLYFNSICHNHPIEDYELEEQTINSSSV